MHLLHKEFLYTLRSSSRSPIFAAAFILAIAVGIGSAVSVFTVMDALLLRPLPVPHPEQLVELTGIYRTHSLTPLSYPMYAEMERDQRAFSQICGWSVGSDFYVEINGTGSLANVRSVTGSYYSVLGTRPLLGRLIEPSDMQSNGQVAVIGYQLWQKRFGGDAPSSAGPSALRTISSPSSVSRPDGSPASPSALLRRSPFLSALPACMTGKAAPCSGSSPQAAFIPANPSAMLNRKSNPSGRLCWQPPSPRRAPAGGVNPSSPWASSSTPPRVELRQSAISAPRSSAPSTCCSVS
jgi:hypothetical protein